jgi:hypothetical protein
MPPREPTVHGFNSQTFQPTFNSGYLCRDSTRVAASAVSGALRGAFILVDFQQTSGECLAHGITPVPELARLVFPALTPPPGLEMKRAGSSGGSNSIETAGTINDRATAPSVIGAHYAKLLIGAGWTVDTPVANSTALIQTVHAMDKDAKPWDGFLMVIATATTRELRLSMTRRTDAE